MKVKFITTMIMLFVMFVLTGMAYAQPDLSKPIPEEFIRQRQGQFREVMPQSHKRPSPEEFERRLNLTDEQKAFAKEQRSLCIEKIKPVLEQINQKKAQKEQLETQAAGIEELTRLDNEIKELRKQAHEIRRQNMKSFEAMLSDGQKKELQRMKNEGRREFEKNHKMNK